MVAKPHSYPVALIPFRIGIWEGENARKAFWDGERKAFAICFRPSLDAPRTHQILPITARTREATGYESLAKLTCQHTVGLKVSVYSTRISFVSPCRTLSFTGGELVAVKLNWHFFLIITACGELIFYTYFLSQYSSKFPQNERQGSSSEVRDCGKLIQSLKERGI